jgi:hypothetical protein
MNGFDPRKAPDVIAVRLNNTSERALKKAIKKLTRHFHTGNSMLNLLQIAEYHGYFIGVFDNYFYVIHEESEFSITSLEEPEFWRMTLHSEPDTQVIQRIK